MQWYPIWPPATPPVALDLEAAARAYAYPPDPPDDWWLRANMVSTADGAAVGPDGITRRISSDADRDLLALLRALADVVVVGYSTARIEGYGPERVRPEHLRLRKDAGQPPAAAIAVVSSSLNIDLDAPLFTEAENRTILLTTSDAPAERLREASRRSTVDVAIAGTGRVDPVAAVAALVERGHRRLLCEGGPRWLTSVVAAGALDELCLTISPLLLGGGEFRMLGPAPLADPHRMRLAGICSDGESLFVRYLLGNRPANTSSRSNDTGSSSWA